MNHGIAVPDTDSQAGAEDRRAALALFKQEFDVAIADAERRLHDSYSTDPADGELATRLALAAARALDREAEKVRNEWEQMDALLTGDAPPLPRA